MVGKKWGKLMQNPYFLFPKAKLPNNLKPKKLIWACPSCVGSGFTLQVLGLVPRPAGFPLQSLTRHRRLYWK